MIYGGPQVALVTGRFRGKQSAPTSAGRTVVSSPGGTESDFSSRGGLGEQPLN